MNLVSTMIAALLLSTAAVADPETEWPDAEPVIEAQGDIDLSLYKLSFSEEFDRLSVSGRRCDSRWIAHTPWNGDFGGAAFADPSRGFPFKTRRGVLRIEARKISSDEWLAGLLSLRNTCDKGFAQLYGYFEARMMLPAEDGMWSAFWLIGVDRDMATAEVDVMEHLGHMPDRYTTALHLHPRVETVERLDAGSAVNAEEGALSKGFNTFGVSVEEKETIFYFNRREIWRQPTTPEFRQPMYPIVNLAMDRGYISADTPERAYLYVDYVRVYQRKP
ncbi:MAG: glycoside hydrolase family 16 protein [Parvularculaceae bacterium]